MAALFTILGPFGASDQMPLVQAFLYWLLIASVTYSVGFLSNAGMQQALPKTWNKLSRIATISLVTTIGITPFVAMLNFSELNNFPHPVTWIKLTAKIFSVALIIHTIFHIINDQVARAAQKSGEILPALLERLTQEKRGRIIALSSQDHYALVQTTSGK